MPRKLEGTNFHKRSLHLTDRQVTRLDEIGRALGLPPSELNRRALDDFIDNYDQQKALLTNQQMDKAA